MLANVTCPACQHKYWIQEGEMGSRQICPNCQSPFFAGKSVAEARPAKLPAASAALQANYAKTMIGDTAPAIKYNCPRCKAPLEAEASEAGTKKNCSNCTQRLQVPAASKPMAASANLNKTMFAGEESAAPPRPPIKYNCPSCKQPLEAPAEQGGTKTNCPSCKQRLQIPAAMPIPSNRNITMLASDGSTAAANASQAAYSAGGVAGSSPVAAGSAPGANPWKAQLTPRNVAIAIVMLLFLLLVIPALIRGGKETDKETLAKTQMELEKLKAEIELKKIEMDRQAKVGTNAQRQIDEMLRNSKAEADRRSEELRQQMAREDDDDRRATLKRRLAQDQLKRDQERQEMERKSKEVLDDVKRKLDESDRALKAAQQKQQTIIQQPAPVIYHPFYSPYYYRPWWW